MADQADKTASVTKSSWKRRPVLAAAVLLIMVVAVVIGVVIVRNRDATNKAALVQLQGLQNNLQVATNGANPAGVIDLTTTILNGYTNKTFKLTAAQASTYYLDRANAYLTQNQYQKAVSDYRQASSLDSANQLVALQGEVEARYKMGDRKQLIPLYQQMVTLQKNSQNPRRGSEVAQYQANIQTLQQGGELQF